MDGFQGREVDVVLFSCVRAASEGGRGGWGTIGFLSDRRRMNVAITRAKRSLIVFGNVKRLASDRTWRALVEHAASLKRLVPGGGGGAGETPTGEALCAQLEAMAKVHPPAAASGTRRERGAMGNSGQEGRDGGGGEHNVDDAPRRKKKIISSQEDKCRLASGSREDCDADAGEQDDVQKKNQTRDMASTNGQLGGDVKSRDRGNRREARDDVRSGKSKKLLGASDSGLRRGAGGDTTGDNSTDTGASTLRREQRADARDRNTASAGNRKGRDTNGGGSGDVERPAKRPREVRSSNDASSNKKASSGSDGDGFNLGGLLGSINSNAAGIASGKEHDFRRGLQGGVVREYCAYKEYEKCYGTVFYAGGVLDCPFYRNYVLM